MSKLMKLMINMSLKLYSNIIFNEDNPKNTTKIADINLENQ